MQMSQVYDEKIEIFFLTKQKMPNKTIVCKKKNSSQLSITDMKKHYLFNVNLF